MHIRTLQLLLQNLSWVIENDFKPFWTSEQAVLCGIVLFTKMSWIRHYCPKFCYVNHMNKVAPFSVSPANLELQTWNANGTMPEVDVQVYWAIYLVTCPKKCPKLGHLTLYEPILGYQMTHVSQKLWKAWLLPDDVALHSRLANFAPNTRVLIS